MQELLNKKILVVDDEQDLLKMIENTLFAEGFFYVYTALNCKKAIELARSQPIALFLLDINLPDGNGFLLFQEIRKVSQAPVIFLTARGEADDKIHGFGLGADDYIVKPFLPKELVLRIKALLRRTYGIGNKQTGFLVGTRQVDFETAMIKKNGKQTPLTAKELILIKKLWDHKNRIVTNDALCMAAWGEDYYGHENNLMVHIRHLREKIEDQPSKPVYLITMKGLGYKLVIPNE